MLNSTILAFIRKIMSIIKLGSSFLAATLMLQVLSADVKSSVIDVIKLRTNQDVTVESVIDLKGSDLKIMVLKDTENKTLVPVVTDKNGESVFLLTNAFFTKNQADGETIAQINNSVQVKNTSAKNAAALNAMFAKVPKSYMITLESSNPKNRSKNTFIVSDPSCPHCQAEYKNINERLKSSNVTMVLVSFLGPTSINRGSYILEELKGKKSNKDKLKVLDKVYTNPSFNPNLKDAQKKDIQNITNIIHEAGLVQGVPFIYEEQK